MVTRFTAVVTADRYGAKGANLEHERELLAGFPDIDVDLRGEPIHSEDELIALGNEADALFLSTRDAVTRRFCEQSGKVKVVARYGVGLDNVDLAAAADHGIVITHYPQYCTNEVADHALALLLTLNRRIAELSTDLHADAWNTHGRMTREILRGPIEPLYKQTIGVIALGRIGSAVVSRLRPFGSRIIVCDPYVDDDQIRALGAEPVSLDELVSTADMITIHCPLTPETRGLLGPAQFAAMKPHVSIVNTARGPIINQAALIDFLTSHPDTALPDSQRPAHAAFGLLFRGVDPDRPRPDIPFRHRRVARLPAADRCQPRRARQGETGAGSGLNLGAGGYPNPGHVRLRR
jgi:D-3-phosphoglycerate dehydrogenase